MCVQNNDEFVNDAEAEVLIRLTAHGLKGSIFN